MGGGGRSAGSLGNQISGNSSLGNAHCCNQAIPPRLRGGPPNRFPAKSRRELTARGRLDVVCFGRATFNKGGFEDRVQCFTPVGVRSTDVRGRRSADNAVAGNYLPIVGGENEEVVFSRTVGETRAKGGKGNSIPPLPQHPNPVLRRSDDKTDPCHTGQINKYDLESAEQRKRQASGFQLSFHVLLLRANDPLAIIGVESGIIREFYLLHSKRTLLN